MQSSTQGIGVFFEPQSVAVVGASRDPAKYGNWILRNMLRLGYRGRVFPVNSHAREIEGLRSYPSVREIPGEVDIVVISVPAPLVTNIMRDCREKGVKGVVIFTSGFAESGGEGTYWQQELLAIASEAGIRVIGPNTTGTVDAYSRFTTSPYVTEQLKGGSVAFIAQTGMFAGAMLNWLLSTEKFGISKVAGLGNRCDVTETEILEYLAEDPHTKVIMMYLEGVENGRRFLEVVRELSRRKPIVVLKGGTTQQGAKAALSHTGSIAGRDEVFDAALKQAGVIRASGFQELVDFAKILAYQPPSPGNRTAIVTLTGAGGVLATDLCLQAGLSIADLQPSTLQKVQQHLPPRAKAGNPLDVEPLSDNMSLEEGYKLALEVVLGDQNVDCCLLIMLGGAVGNEFDATLVDIKNAYPEKPLSVCFIGSKEAYDQFSPAIEEAEIPVFPSVQRAVNSLAILHKYKLLTA